MVMALAFSISIIALGAVLRWPIGGSVAGVSLATLGLALMIAGIMGGLLWLAVTATHDPGHDGSAPRDTT
jgi:hypothetical protein